VNDFDVSDIKTKNFFRDEELVTDPYPYFDALRSECPVWRESHHDVAMVTGYDEAVEVLNDPERFSSCISVTGPFPGFPVPLEGDDISGLIEQYRDQLPMNDQLPTLDPPTHTDHRALLMRLITPKRLKENEESMWQLADQVLDGFLVGGEGEFIGQFAAPFTLLVIADLLGVPEDDRDEIVKVLQSGAHKSGVGSTGEDTLALSPLEFLYTRFTTYIEERRTQPRGDVLTGLATATFPDGRTPEVVDAVRVAANVFSAGQETTVRLLASALKILGEHPEIQRQLREDRSLITNFIEETLRTESPVKGDFRLSKVPTTIGGVDLPAGTTLMLLNGAVNRDPSRYECPADFDVTRSNARTHLSFGRGIHTCPGAPLARAETRVCLERILDRTTDIRISEREHGPAGQRKYDYFPTFILRGLTKLHLEFTLAGDALS
jgi:cytochrome P450